MELSPNELARKVCEGDLESANKLIDIQRTGRALRLYPYGRKGGGDDGMALLTSAVCPERKLIHIRFGVYSSFPLRKEQVGPFIRTIMVRAYDAYQLHLEYDNPWQEMESKVQEDFEIRVQEEEETLLRIRFLPFGQLDYYFGLRHARFLCKFLFLHADALKWGAEDLGIEQEEYENSRVFAFGRKNL